MVEIIKVTQRRKLVGYIRVGNHRAVVLKLHIRITREIFKTPILQVILNTN